MLTRTVQQAAGVDVHYMRDDDIRQMRVAVSDITIETIEAGTTVIAEATQFRIPTDDLYFGGRLVRPEPGDRIKLWRGGRLRVYEVMPVGDKSHCKPADAYYAAWLVYTKLVEE